MGKRALYGCGCSWGVPWTDGAGGESHEGKSRVQYTPDAGPPFSQTCSRWYWMSPEVQSVIDWLPDYKRGALGPVQHLEAPLLSYLRAAEAAEGAWQASLSASKKGPHHG